MPTDAEGSPAFDANDLTCVCSGSDNLFLASNNGDVRILSQALKVVRTFKAHDSGSITQMKQVEGTALLVTISEDLSNEPLLKVWALDKTEKKTGAPKCLSSLEIHNGRKSFPVWYYVCVGGTKADWPRYQLSQHLIISLSLRLALRTAPLLLYEAILLTIEARNNELSLSQKSPSQGLNFVRDRQHYCT